MIHSLLALVATRPLLLAAHAEAYAALAAAELGEASAGWQRRLLLTAVALCGLTLAMAMAGVALLMWALLPEAAARVPWVLIAVPSLPLIAGLACLGAARKTVGRAAFVRLREQLQADLRMLREAVGP